MKNEQICKDITVMLCMGGNPFARTEWGTRCVTDVTVSTREGLVIIEYYIQPKLSKSIICFPKDNVVSVLIN